MGWRCGTGGEEIEKIKVSKMDFGNGEKYVGVHGKRGIAKRNVKRKGRIENIDV